MFPDGTRMRPPAKNFHDLPSKNRFVDGACAEENRILMPMSKRGPPMTPAPDLSPVGCGACGNVKALRVCQRCKGVIYCDEICQRRCWKQHQLVCLSPKALFARYDEEQKSLQAEEEKSHQLEVANVLREFMVRQNSTGLPDSEKTKPPKQRPPWLQRKVEALPKSEEQVPSVPSEPRVATSVTRPPEMSAARVADYISLSSVREVKMPCVILGTAGQRGLQGKRGRAAILNALKMGYRGIDTSEMNRNLFDVGWACKASTLERRELFLTMKIPPWSHGYEATKSSFARQLQQLQSDYVDLLLVQWPHVWRQEQKEWGPMQWRRVNQWQAGQLQGTWAAMEEICKSGKAKAIGVSNYTMQHMEALLKYCTVRPAVLQGESHPHWPNRSLRDWCRKHDIAFQGYAPFGGQETPENSGHRPVDDAFLKKVAECNGLSNFQVCMQWNQSRNSSTVVQSQDKKHLRENLTACNVNLCSATDFKGIDENAKEHSQYGPCYWGDNDKDNLNIWKDEEKLLEAVLPEPRGHHWSPKAKTPEEMRKEGWEPLVPPEALPPAKREGNR